MVKLTVLYNLPDGADHDAFVRWRTTTHQASNAAAPGVVRTDFYVARDTALGAPAFRYITEAYFRTMAELERAFLTDEAQAQLRRDLTRIKDPVFLISEEIVSSGAAPSEG